MSSIAIAQIMDSAYLVAIILFILAIKWMNSPSTARRGVLMAEIGGALAVAATLADPQVTQYKWIAIALIVGAAVGIPLGMVKMTAVPQRTAMALTFGSLSATMIGIAEYYVGYPHVARFGMGEISLEVIIGSLTFTGSLIAAGKLQEILPLRPMVYKGQNVVSLSVLGAALLLAVAMVVHPNQAILFPIMIGVSLVFGILLVTPIGGADMPTVISLLNSYAGIAAAMLGFVLDS
ncbi:MAG TPA: NAD(P)(+) transhydrogenase (Re/Si-specific) subunit beta, partial [Candidatus Dormibacteraeota bacterium]|nr:NAD(P)(+) transhydrogenase (Re/Si-specific) subunit beta [Candidatus Dormibacteraeota bacterium]